MSYDGHEIIAIWLFDPSDADLVQESVLSVIRDDDDARDAFWRTNRSFGYGNNHPTTVAQLLEVVDIEFDSAEDRWDLELDNYTEVGLLSSDDVSGAVEFLDELFEDPEEATEQIRRVASSDTPVDELLERLLAFDPDAEVPIEDGERLVDFVAAFAAALRAADDEGLALVLLRIEVPAY